MMKCNAVSIFNEPWAILPARLAEMTSQYEQLLERAKAGSFDDLFDDDETSEDGVTEIGSVAVVSIVGVLMKRESWWMRWFGGNSMDRLRHTIERLAQKATVRTIVLDLDCPGGTVAGTAELGNTIFAARQQKQVVAVVNELAASGGCWIGAAAERVVIGESAMMGHIGVIQKHFDWTAAAAELGVKPTLFTAGRYKAVGDPYKPIDDDGRTVFQGIIDEYYRQFVDAVAHFRGRSFDEVLTNMADARLFIGQQAIDAGLADEIGTLDEVVNDLADTAVTSFSNGANQYVQGNQQHARRIERR